MILLIQYFLCVHVLTTTYTHSFLIIIVILLRIIISQIIPFEDISKFQKHRLYSNKGERQEKKLFLRFVCETLRRISCVLIIC